MRVPVRAFVTCACVLTGVKPRRRVTATTAENHTRSGPRSATPCAGIRLFFFLPFRFVFFTPLIPVVICVFVVCHPDSYYYNIYSPIISPLPTSPPPPSPQPILYFTYTPRIILYYGRCVSSFGSALPDTQRH